MKDILGRTQYAKILTIMLRSPRQPWWYAPDFMRPGLGDLFVGYEAGPRLSEMARKWPDLLETRQHPTEPKYLQRRIRWENIEVAKAMVPSDLSTIISDEMRVLGITPDSVRGMGEQQSLLP